MKGVPIDKMENTKERNKEIYSKRKNGTSVAMLSMEYSLSDSRIRAICKRQDEKLKNEEDLLYMAIRLFTTDVGFARKVRNVLKRNGIHTVEDVKTLTDEKLRKMRYCGPKMVDLLNNFRSMAGGKSNE